MPVMARLSGMLVMEGMTEIAGMLGMSVMP